MLGLTLACFSACKEDKKTKSTKATEDEIITSDLNRTGQAPAKIEKRQVFNANLATEDNLKSLGLSDETIDNILENRPFMSIAELTTLLGDLATTELITYLFVPMNLNTTSEADFKVIPGVGDKMAHEFEEYRPYTNVAQFKTEIGKYVDDEVVEMYLNYVFVPVELNTASENDIKALPGVGNRIAHEFIEYRPYQSMDQFRKELGKYVDAKELKRLERLVYLK